MEYIMILHHSANHELQMRVPQELQEPFMTWVIRETVPEHRYDYLNGYIIETIVRRLLRLRDEIHGQSC